MQRAPTYYPWKKNRRNFTEVTEISVISTGTEIFLFRAKKFEVGRAQAAHLMASSAVLHFGQILVKF